MAGTAPSTWPGQAAAVSFREEQEEEEDEPGAVGRSSGFGGGRTRTPLFIVPPCGEGLLGALGFAQCPRDVLLGAVWIPGNIALARGCCAWCDARLSPGGTCGGLSPHLGVSGKLLGLGVSPGEPRCARRSQAPGLCQPQLGPGQCPAHWEHPARILGSLLGAQGRTGMG